MDITLVIEKQAKPFLKWAGGKGQLLNEIEKRLPKELLDGHIDTYIEPFVGGGAAFFFIAQKFDSIKHFYLFDINQDLVNCYNIIKENVDSLIDELDILQNEFDSKSKEHQKEYYLDIRRSFNSEKAKDFGVNTAAKLIFLNKTCFNGLYRVNSKGEFNVPFGDYKNPNICNAENLTAVSSVLQKAEIYCLDFRMSQKYINEGTFVYFDPPYRPISRTASFTSYTKEDFTEKDQCELAEFCKTIDAKGAKFLLSNSDPKNEDPNDHFFEDNYKNFNIDRVKASRSINCKSSGRGQIFELLITNYLMD